MKEENETTLGEEYLNAIQKMEKFVEVPFSITPAQFRRLKYALIDLIKMNLPKAKRPKRYKQKILALKTPLDYKAYCERFPYLEEILQREEQKDPYFFLLYQYLEYQKKYGSQEP